jgi:hypothetical protein
VKSKDQLLLEQAYSSIYQTKFVLKELYYLDEKGFWKKVAPYAVGAAMALNGLGSAKAQDAQPPSRDYNVSQSSLYTSDVNNLEKTANDTTPETVKIKSVTQVIETTLKGKGVKDIVLNVIESDNGNRRDVVIEIGGTVNASSQEEANKLAMDMVKEAMDGQGITLKGLVVYENSQPFNFRLKLTV